MRLDKITREVFIEVEGKEYTLILTLSGLQQLEASIGDNLLMMLQRQPMPSLNTLVTAFYIGLGRKYTKSDAEKILSDYMNEYGMGGNDGDTDGAVTVFYAMIAASGILGKKTSVELLKQFGLIDEEIREKKEKTVKKEKS